MKAKELNGYYYCFSFSDCSYDLYSIAEMSRKEAIFNAIDNGVRLYLVKYRKGIQQGKKKRIPTAKYAQKNNDRDICRKGETRQYEDYRGIT